MPAPVVAYAAKRVAGTHAGRWLLAAPLVLLVGLPMMLLLGIAGVPAEAGACGPGTVVPASADLDAPTLAGINALKADYEAVSGYDGLPWAWLAALDYRENANAPDRSAISGEPLGTPNPDHPEITTTTKRDSLSRAGEMLRSLASGTYGITLSGASPAEDVQRAFLAYNRGGIYAATSPPTPPDRSPYVMNQADAAHHDMAWPDIPGEPLAGQVEAGRYGAWTIVLRLGGGRCGLSSTNIVAIAQADVGLSEVPDGCNCGDQIAKFLGSAGPEQWCADALSWWHREAGIPFTGGADGGWRLAGVSDIVAWHRANGTWTERDPSHPPQPGATISFRNEDHVGLVELVDGATIHVVSGNYGNQVGRSTHTTSDSDVDGWSR